MDLGHARKQYIRWLLITRDLSPHTIRAYDSDIAAFAQHLGANASIAEIDRDRLVAFVEEQRLGGLSSTSIRRRASGLRGFCRWLLASGLLDSDPWAGTRVAVGRSRKLPRVLPSHELDRLFLFLRQAADVDDVTDMAQLLKRPHASTTLLAVALMVATGARVNEAVGIRCQDIDIPSRSIRLVGKGRRERQVFLTNDWISGFTDVYLEMRSALGVRHAHLLFNLRFNPLTTPAMRSRLAKAAQAAGLNTRVTPHMLRHTAATQLIEAGVDIRYIQRLLGHASLSTTEIYTHVSDRALRRVVSDADVLGRVVEHR
jgi:site-specific recombinase XerD